MCETSEIAESDYTESAMSRRGMDVVGWSIDVLGGHCRYILGSGPDLETHEVSSGIPDGSPNVWIT